MEPVLLSGNEAVARGAWEAGVLVGVGYPGTPSTEVLENLARLEGAYAEWAPNEKVALEVATGVSVGGGRVLVTMKHVGLNVAADVLYTLSYSGVGAGLVLLVADDPGMHSSQNEQDTRLHAAAARVPLLEPSDSGEARAFTMRAFALSEELDLPVIVRSATRLAHSKGLVEVGERTETPGRGYASDPRKYVMMPSNARVRRVDLESRSERAAVVAEEAAHAEMRDPALGVITSGVPYQYVREAAPDASVLKLDMPHPFPVEAVRGFASRVERVVVVEESSPYLESKVKELGIEVEDVAPGHVGELGVTRVAEALGVPAPEPGDPARGLPMRPPMLCPGCPHRGVFHALRKMKAAVMGDIGCYTLGALPPLSAMDTTICMGASIGMAHGMWLAERDRDRPVVAVIGDSTFAHSGLTGLVHVSYNKGDVTAVILDNRVTAMTGHQDNPVTGRTLMGEETFELDLEDVARALGASSVRTVDPHDLPATEAVLREEDAREGLSVVIAKAPCALLVKETEQVFAVDEDACTACGVCIRLGCPAISKAPDGRAVIDVALCVGCEQCVHVCRFDAILPTGSVCEVPS